MLHFAIMKGGNNIKQKKNVITKWMMSDRTRGNAPLVCTCPNGCKFFQAKFKHTEVVERRYSSDPYGYIEKTTTTWSEV